MTLDPLTVLVCALAIFLVTFMKGAFGGGFAIIGIPLMALVMDPIQAGALLAPLFVVADVVAVRYWRPSTWSRPDLAVLVPGLLAGTGLGYLTLRYADRGLVATVIALITLGFAALWFLGGGRVVARPRNRVKGAAAGLASGMGSMLAHAGGPPVAMYLLPLGLPKQVYAGTTFLYFVVANAAKVGPWLTLAEPTAAMGWLFALCLPVIPLGVWAGWRLHARLDQQQLYRACYGMLMVVALKLLYDGLSTVRLG